MQAFVYPRSTTTDKSDPNFYQERMTEHVNGMFEMTLKDLQIPLEFPVHLQFEIEFSLDAIIYDVGVKKETCYSKSNHIRF